MPNMVQVGGMHIKPPQELPNVRSGKIYSQFYLLQKFVKILTVVP
jgi:hypothetical protein